MTPYYEHGGITLYHGDCREILPHLPKVDLVLTDPPYGIGKPIFRNHKAKSAAVRRTDYRDDLSWDKRPADLSVMFACCDDADMVIWGGNYFQLAARPGWLVWDKLNGTNRFADAELAWTTLEQAVRIFRFMWNGMLRDGEPIVRQHPTQKPLELMAWCIGFFPEAQTILDPFCGSGTTLRAAKDLGRRAIGIEICEKYCEIAARRMEQEVLPLTTPTP